MCLSPPQVIGQGLKESVQKEGVFTQSNLLQLFRQVPIHTIQAQVPVALGIALLIKGD